MGQGKEARRTPGFHLRRWRAEKCVEGISPKAQIRRIEPYFPLSHGVARVDDRRVISGIIFVIRNGLRWRDGPKDYGQHKTIYNRFVPWSRMAVFNRIFAKLSAKGPKPEQPMIDATHLKAHRTAASLQKKGMFPDVSDAPTAA